MMTHRCSRRVYHSPVTLGFKERVAGVHRNIQGRRHAIEVDGSEEFKVEIGICQGCSRQSPLCYYNTTPIRHGSVPGMRVLDCLTPAKWKPTWRFPPIAVQMARFVAFPSEQLVAARTRDIQVQLVIGRSQEVTSQRMMQIQIVGAPEDRTMLGNIVSRGRK